MVISFCIYADNLLIVFDREQELMSAVNKTRR